MDHRSRSRREFLQVLAAMPVAVGLGARFSNAMALPGQAHIVAPSLKFPQPGFIRYDGHCFSVRDHDTFLFGATFHYPRCPRELWPDRLLKLKAAGFNVIETYVFWNYHEPVEGRVDLSEFEDFVRLVADSGFHMIARPGPYVCAEWDSGGFPRWVVKRGFPLRSPHPDSLRTSEHWFSEVLPVIARHQVTHSGPIILMQVENEYDYWEIPDADKAAYVRALAEMAWKAGIDIPLITCWTKPVRDRQDPVFARMMDTCNFYPRWNVVKEVIPALTELRAAQPDAPLGVTELQGGWFSEFGGQLSVDQDGVNARQLNLVSKTAMEQGVSYFNYYMGFGGTNFDWAAKNLTTTYDYAAPLREPGGLWEKYYAARGIGASLRLFGNVLTRADAAPNAAQSTNPQVSVTLRTHGKSGAVFIRENGNDTQRFKATFQDPNSPTHRVISVPREGELELAPFEMKMLPVQILIGEYRLCYSTAEILEYGEGGRPYLVLYDEPGRLVEFSLATEKEPHLEGDVAYRYRDEEYDAWVCGLKVAAEPQMLLYENHFQIVVMPRERALRTWSTKWPVTVLPVSGALPDQERKDTFLIPFFGDAALLAGTGRNKKTIWAEFDFAPGEHEMTALVPPLPSKLWLDAVPADFDFDKHWQTFRFHVSTPKLAVSAQPLTAAPRLLERFDRNQGEWFSGPLRPLDDLGALPYGYVKYRAAFNYAGEPRMFTRAFTDDGRKLFINGKLVAEGSKKGKNVDFALDGVARNGANSIEIAYELFGASNGGVEMEDLKGFDAIRFGSDESSAKPITSWQIQRFPAPMDGRRINPAYFARMKNAAPPAAGATGINPAFLWCQAEFALDAPPAEWSIPWKLTIDAERDALLYLNGRFVGRYVIAGPQKDFFLPDPYLAFGPKSRNLLTVVLAYTESASVLHTLTVGPYEEYATRRTRVEIQW